MSTVCKSSIRLSAVAVPIERTYLCRRTAPGHDAQELRRFRGQASVMPALATKGSRLVSRDHLERSPAVGGQELRDISQVVIERDGHRRLIHVRTQPDGAAHVLIVDVQVGKKVTPDVVSERAQSLLELRRFAIPFGDQIAGASALGCARPAAWPIRPRRCRRPQETARRSDRRRGRRRERARLGPTTPASPEPEPSLCFRQRQHHCDELATRAFVQARWVHGRRTRRVSIVHPAGLPAPASLRKRPMAPLRVTYDPSDRPQYF